MAVLGGFWGPSMEGVPELWLLPDDVDLVLSDRLGADSIACACAMTSGSSSDFDLRIGR